MADLTPGELAKIDQIHASITAKLAELVSSAVDGIRTEGEALTASALAGTAQGTDHNSVSALLAASLVLNARYQMADEKVIKRLESMTERADKAEISRDRLFRAVRELTTWADGDQREDVPVEEILDLLGDVN